MRRRLLLAVVGTVVTALLLAGLGTLALSWLGARRYVEADLRQQAEAVSESFPGLLANRPADEATRRLFVNALRRAFRLDGVAIMNLAATGVLSGEPPEGLSVAVLDLERLALGEVVSGHDGRLVYAAAIVGRGPAGTVVVLTDRSGIELGGAVPWFLTAALVVIVMAVIVANRLARIVTEPLERANQASRRIAAGDLSVRLPDTRGGRELEELTASINAMSTALQRSRGLEQQFLLSVSHDLRTPLTSIQGYAEAVADGTVDDPSRAGEVIVAEARRLDRLVRDLLELARLDARTFSFALRPTDLGEVVAGCIDGFEPEAREAGLGLRLDAASSAAEPAPFPGLVTADPDRLAQVVANLLTNALKFAATEVVVSVLPVGGSVRVTVDDDGPGIAAEDLPHVFERLYVARSRPVRKESGSGLGLAIVRELVTAMGGSVGAERSPAGGARLWFELPATG